VYYNTWLKILNKLIIYTPCPEKTS